MPCTDSLQRAVALATWMLMEARKGRKSCLGGEAEDHPDSQAVVWLLPGDRWSGYRCSVAALPWLSLLISMVSSAM